VECTFDHWKTGKGTTWSLKINETEVKAQMLCTSKITEEKMKDETAKRQKTVKNSK